MKNILLILALLFTTAAYADEKTHITAAQSLTKAVMGAVNFEELQVQVALKSFNGLIAELPPSPEKTQVAKIISNVINTVTRKWSPVLQKESERIYIEFFVENFAEQELSDLALLFQTKIGQKYLAKQQDLAVLVATKILPTSQAMQREMGLEMEKALAAAGIE